MTLKQLEDATKILFLGDSHGDYSFVEKALHTAHNLSADVIIQLGDFGIWPGQSGAAFRTLVSEYSWKYDIPVFFIDGNHEDFDWLLAQPLDEDGLRPILPGLVHIPRGFRWTSSVSGETFLALGGATSVDADRRTLGKSFWLQESITDEDVEKTVSGGQADIMLTHDCPVGTSIPGIEHRKYVSYFDHSELERAWDHREKLREAVDVIKPKRLFHGHFHVKYEDQLVYDDGSVTEVVGLGANISTDRLDTFILYSM